jgi:hypothetical protein
LRKSLGPRIELLACLRKGLGPRIELLACLRKGLVTGAHLVRSGG